MWDFPPLLFGPRVSMREKILTDRFFSGRFILRWQESTQYFLWRSSRCSNILQHSIHFTLYVDSFRFSVTYNAKILNVLNFIRINRRHIPVTQTMILLPMPNCWSFQRNRSISPKKWTKRLFGNKWTKAITVPQRQQAMQINRNESMESTQSTSFQWLWKKNWDKKKIITNFVCSNIHSSSDKKLTSSSAPKKDSSPKGDERMSTMAEEDENENARIGTPQNLSQV